MTPATPTPPPSRADEFRLPTVGGRKIETSNDEFERKCLVHLEAEQRKLLPDNSLIALLCEAVRCVREYNDYAAASFKSNGEYLERRSADGQLIRSLESRLLSSEASRAEAEAAKVQIGSAFVTALLGFKSAETFLSIVKGKSRDRFEGCLFCGQHSTLGHAEGCALVRFEKAVKETNDSLATRPTPSQEAPK